MTNHETGLPARIAALQQDIAQADPQALAARAGATYVTYENALGGEHPSQGELSLHLWGREVRITFPQISPRWADSEQPPGLLDQGLLAYYLTLTDGTQPTGRWISFTELPDGRFYTRAFQGYTGDVLQRVIGADLAVFEQAALACRGEHFNLGDAAFAFQALPHVPVLVVAWLGDEDFPGSYQVLFDATAPHHLTTDGCAILGSALVRRLQQYIRVS
jgi:hypothetical protein